MAPDIEHGHVRERASWVLAAATVVLVSCTSTAPADVMAPPPGRLGTDAFYSQLVRGVTGDGAMIHADAMQRIADENGGNRASPGPGYDASVDYVASVLRDAGFDVSTPSFLLRERDGDETTVRNVVAQTRTGSPEHVVLAGAHLDSVSDGPGINDNGSGVAALLEIAVQMGGSPQVPNMVRIGFWGAEEVDLDGSTSYVESLSRTERDAIAFYLNLDMLASPNAGFFVQGGNGEDESETGPPGSAVVGRVLLEELATQGVAAEPDTFDGSDYEPFVEAGIPSAGVHAGDAGTKTVEQASRWGGRAGDEFDACYHSACDRSDNLDRAALEKFSDAVAGAIGRFASSAQGLPR